MSPTDTARYRLKVAALPLDDTDTEPSLDDLAGLDVETAGLLTETFTEDDVDALLNSDEPLLLF